MSEPVRNRGHETRALHTFVFNHFSLNPELNVHHGESKILSACYCNSLALAAENGCTSIAFPCISTGIYDCPKEDAAKIAVRAVQEFLAANNAKDAETEVIFCSFSARDAAVYKHILDLV